jgi:hypothetical protein
MGSESVQNPWERVHRDRSKQHELRQHVLMRQGQRVIGAYRFERKFDPITAITQPGL